MKHFYTFMMLMVFGLPFSVGQDKKIWGEAERRHLPTLGSRPIQPATFRLITLNRAALERLLARAPFENKPNHYNAEAIIDLPLPDGQFMAFKFFESPIIEDKLQKKYPELRTFIGQSIIEPDVSVRFDFLPTGFHALIKSGSNLMFIDPYQPGNSEFYMSYAAAEQRSVKDFACHLPESMERQIPEFSAENYRSGGFVGEQLKKLRIAIAVTGEYAAFHGGKVPDVLSAVVTTLNRVNTIYETEVASRLILVGDNDRLIFTNPDSDPYTNADLNRMLDENQTTIDNLIGSTNYDIGHVFGTRGGGLAGINVICSDKKAWGATGISTPVGDFFDVVYVCHELGHQFGAPHSFNSCGSNGGGGSTAYEPGSGTTIMAYAGICGTDNIQSDTDHFFHSGSYSKIIEGGNSCASFEPTNNAVPNVWVTDPSGLVIPISTPFKLTGSGEDPDGDPLVYSWDEMDLGPISPLGAPSGTAPLFRYRAPTRNPTRIFPYMPDLINNVTSRAEVLPNYSRELKFRITARDQKLGGGGVSFATYSLQVTDKAGPFLVTSPNTSLEWIAGDTKAVTWEVANTDEAPVNCDLVDILLSTDGGQDFSIVLASSVPNSGSATIVVPEQTGDRNRVMISCANNVFFDISNENFLITRSVSPTFSITPYDLHHTGCGNDQLNYSFKITGLGGFNAPVEIAAIDLPDGAVASFEPQPVYPDAEVEMTIGNLQNAASGSYTIQVKGSSDSIEIGTSVKLELFAAVPTVDLQPESPVDFETGVELREEINWSFDREATLYHIEIATSPGFGATVIETGETSHNSYTPTQLTYRTVYYWRVRASNVCGAGKYSDTFSFQTESQGCTEFKSLDIPKVITADFPNKVTSSVEVLDDHIITDFDLTRISALHSFVSDLSIKLISPEGRTAILFSEICNDAENLELGFDDEATNEQITCPPTSGGSYKPHQALSIFDGTCSKGLWTLEVEDLYNQDGGSLNNWSMQICYDPPVIQPVEIVNNGLHTIEPEEKAIISSSHLRSTQLNSSTEQIFYILTSLPSHGKLILNANPLQVGELFSQADIDNKHLKYQHGGGIATTDQFLFDVSAGGSWWPHNSFKISIQQGTILAISGNIDQPLQCFNDINAQISADVSGGVQPYLFAINAGVWQESPIFSGLSNGSFTLTVKDGEGTIRSTPPIVIKNPPPLEVHPTVTGEMIIVQATGGTGDLHFSIDGSNFQSSNLFPDLPNGEYEVTVRDANDCTVSNLAVVNTINITAALEISQSIQCFDGSDGAIVATVSGGTPPFRYSIDSISYQGEAIFDNLSRGAYRVKVIDAEGLSTTTNAVTLSDPHPIHIEAESVEETLTVSAAGGTGIFEYSLDGINYQKDNVFSGLNNGDYTVMVRDANGCTASTMVSMLINDLAVQLNVINGISCYAENDGIIGVNITGGTPPYQSSLNGGLFQDHLQFSNLSAGAYSVMVRDSNRFTRLTDTLVLHDPPRLQLDAVVTGNSIEVYAQGGTGQISYSLDGDIYQASPVFEDLPRGNYTIVVKDEKNCTADTTAWIRANTLEAVATIEQHLSCRNSKDGKISVSASGGEAPLKYSINGGEHYQDENVFSGLGWGGYIVTVKDAAGFTRATPQLTLLNPETIIVEPEISGATITVHATGGTGSFSYSIDGVNFQSSNLFKNVTDGDYILTAKDENGCKGLALASVIMTTVTETAFSNIELYPNPSKGVFTLGITNAARGKLEYYITDMKGSTMRREQLQIPSGNLQKVIDLSDYPQGIYQIQIIDGSRLIAKRIVVLH